MQRLCGSLKQDFSTNYENRGSIDGESYLTRKYAFLPLTDSSSIQTYVYLEMITDFVIIKLVIRVIVVREHDAEGNLHAALFLFKRSI